MIHLANSIHLSNGLLSAPARLADGRPKLWKHEKINTGEASPCPAPSLVEWQILPGLIAWHGPLARLVFVAPFLESYDAPVP
jgi:hypothetical protein